MRLTRRLILPVLAATLAMPGTALASKTQESIFQDDQQNALGSPNTNAILDELRTLGVDTIHTLVVWKQFAPGFTSSRRPRGFSPSDPRSYHPGVWDRLDNIVRGAQAHGMQVIATITGPGPKWSSRCRRKTPTCEPSTKEFKSFATAVAKRFTGTYADENDGGTLVPRIFRWSIWNEPNQGGWLSPQFEKRGGQTIPKAPHLYRGLYRAGVSGLRAGGQRRAQIYLGETAPIGRTTGKLTTRPVAPGIFYRELFCLDSRGRKLRGSAARIRGCSGRYSKLTASGVAHHPYNRAGAGRPEGSVPRDHIQIGTLSRLRAVLAQGARAGRIASRRPIFLTEMGWQTNPPDPFAPSRAKAAEYLNQSDWIAYNDSSVRSVAQYLLVDPPRPEEFQTGLRAPDGSPKPSYDAYRLPIWVTRSGSSSVKVWGQARQGGAGEVVAIQNNQGGSWQQVGVVTTTNSRGYFLVKLPRRAGKWRLVWRSVTSREADVERR